MRRFDFLGLRGETVMFGLCLLISALVFGKTVRCGDLRRGVSVAWRGCSVSAWGQDFGVGLILNRSRQRSRQRYALTPRPLI